MCMIVSVTAPASDRETLQRVASRLDGPLAPFVVVDDGEPGISAHGCDLLTDDADWDAATWAMRAEALVELDRAWRTVFALVSGDVEVAATWSGDEIEQVESVSRSEFRHLTARSLLGTHTRYRVLSADGA